MYYISASMLQDWSGCREYFRQRWLEQRRPKKANLHQFFGLCVHKAVEAFWKGQDFGLAFGAATAQVKKLELASLNPEEAHAWDCLVRMLPDVIAAYFSEFGGDPEEYIIATLPPDAQDVLICEFPWKIASGVEDIILLGRIDHVFSGFDLREVKTASLGYKSIEQLRQEYIRNSNLSLYDWYMRQICCTPSAVQVEALVKPFKDHKAECRILPLPEVIAARRRFDADLKWKLTELKHYLDNYQQASPWPMANSEKCYQWPCDFLPACNYGMIPKVEQLYQIQGRKITEEKKSGRAGDTQFP